MKTKFPPKAILVPIDALEPSWSALEVAKRLSAAIGAKLEGIYVEEILPEPGIGAARAVLEKERGLQRVDVQQAAAAAVRDLPKERWHLTTVQGHAAEEILRRAVPRKVQLAVMGTHGRKGSDRLLMGSVAEAVIHKARVPVLVVRAGSTLGSGRVLVPCNQKEYADEALRYAFSFARGIGAELTALYVAPEKEWEVDAETELERHLKEKLGPEGASCVARVVRRGEAREQIALEAESGKYGLVALSGHRRAQVSDVLLGTTAERMMRRCELPFLVVPCDYPTRMAAGPAAARAAK